MTELARQVGQELGEEDGIIVFDPSAFPKQGKKSVGVARQWCGRLGKVDNCQVAVYMAYVSRIDHALVNARLYLPQEWTSDPRTAQGGGRAEGSSLQTRHEQALEMLKRHSDLLPRAWIAGDDEMGRNARFRRDLHESRDSTCWPCPATRSSATSTRHRRHTKVAARFPSGLSTRQPLARRPERRRWTRIDVRDGDKGPLEVEVATCRVRTKIKQRVMKYDETLVVVRSLNEKGATKYDFYFSNAPCGTTIKEFARVALAAHRIEEAIKRGKSEPGLWHYEVRNWPGWHHRQVLSLIATSFSGA